MSGRIGNNAKKGRGGAAARSGATKRSSDRSEADYEYKPKPVKAKRRDKTPKTGRAAAAKESARVSSQAGKAGRARSSRKSGVANGATGATGAVGVGALGSASAAAQVQGGRLEWKPGNMLFPLPAVLVSCGATREEYNLITLAWVGTICSDPPMVSISIRPERHSHTIIKRTGEFVINLTTPAMARVTDWCGVRSGRDFDKFAETGLTPLPAQKVKAPLVAQSPVNLECVVREIKSLGTHDMFIAEVVAVGVDPRLHDAQSGRFDLTGNGLLCYAHGDYYELGRHIGKFGFSVEKKPGKPARKKQGR